MDSLLHFSCASLQRVFGESLHAHASVHRIVYGVSTRVSHMYHHFNCPYYHLHGVVACTRHLYDLKNLDPLSFSLWLIACYSDFFYATFPDYFLSILPHAGTLLSMTALFFFMQLLSLLWGFLSIALSVMCTRAVQHLDHSNILASLSVYWLSDAQESQHITPESAVSTAEFAGSVASVVLGSAVLYIHTCVCVGMCISMQMRVCVCIQIHTYIYIYIYICIYIYILHVYLYQYLYQYLYLYLYPYLFLSQSNVHAQMSTCTCIYIFIYTCTCVHVYMY